MNAAQTASRRPPCEQLRNNDLLLMQAVVVLYANSTDAGIDRSHLQHDLIVGRAEVQIGEPPDVAQPALKWPPLNTRRLSPGASYDLRQQYSSGLGDVEQAASCSADQERSRRTGRPAQSRSRAAQRYDDSSTS